MAEYVVNVSVPVLPVNTEVSIEPLVVIADVSVPQPLIQVDVSLVGAQGPKGEPGEMTWTTTQW